MKNKEVIERILTYHPNIPNYYGCDGYKFGNPEDECTGVISALVPTIEVINKTAELGCNLLIVHEPTFYTTQDCPDWGAGFENSIYNEKKNLLEKHGITIWRDHDHMHVHKPDSIFTGVIRYLGWERYQVKNIGNTIFTYIFEVPPTTVEDMNKFLKEKFMLNGIRYIGKSIDVIHRIAIVGHLTPNAFGSESLCEDGHDLEYATEIIREMEKGIDAIIPGEIVEWTALSYIRDAVQLGKVKAMFNTGHFSLEELGMKYAAEWIAELVEDNISVHYVPSGDIFQFE